MAPANRVAGRARRDAVRGQVFDAVIQLLAAGERFTSLKVSRICEEAGVARSAFYTNFVDKTDLLMQLGEPALDELFRGEIEWLQSDRERGVAGLAARLRAACAVLRRHAPVLAAMAEVAGYDSEFADRWDTGIDRVIDAAAARISAAQSQGLIRPGLDSGSAAKLIVGGVERTMMRHVATEHAGSDTALAEGLADTIWATLFGA
jgi:TetR/AcrR family transcriptional regulator, ethionamide resistance regulator